MGEYHRGSLDLICDTRRVSDSLRFPSSHDKRADRTVITPSGHVRSDFVTSEKEGHREGSQPQYSGFLQPSLPRSEEGRSVETGDRFISPESINTGREIQDGVGPLHQNGYSERRLGGLFRPDRRILPYSDRFLVEEIPSVCGKWGSVPIQGTSLRPQVRSASVHEGYKCCGSVSTYERSTTPSILRRLATPQNRTCNSNSRSVSSLADHSAIGSYSQYAEVGLSSVKEVYVRGDDVSNRPSGDSGPSGQSRFSVPEDQTQSGSGVGNSPIHAVTSGIVKCSSRPSQSRQAPHETPSVSFSVPVASICGLTGTGGSSDGFLQVTPSLVAKSVNLSTRGALDHSASGSVPLYRCQCCGLGSSFRATGLNSPGHVDSGGTLFSHKQLRIESSPASSQTVLCLRCEHNCFIVDGQYYCCVLHSQARRNALPSTLSGDMEVTPLVPGDVVSNSSKTRPRPSKCLSRQSVPPKQNSSGGMDTESECSKLSIHADRDTPGGSFRHQSQSSAATLCVADVRSCSLGSGRTDSRLEPSIRVCVPPVHSGTDRTTKSSTFSTVQNPVDSAILAPEVVVQRPPGLPLGTTDTSSFTRRHSVSATGSASSPKPGNATPSRLDVIKRSIRERNFSRKVASRIAQSRRRSTRIVYDSKWTVFSDWCRARSINPECPSITRIADFLLFLFEEKDLAVSTIKGYRSMLSNTLKFKGGERIGSNPFLSELMRSFELDKPIFRSLTPKWDLSCVLWSLTKAPYEPLSSASLKFLTYKTVFLLAFATARRRSELHALSVETGFIRFNESDDSLTLLCQPGFLAKNQLPSVLPKPITVPSLSGNCGPSDTDRLLCPVRALKFYLKRVEGKRGRRKRLFLPLIGCKDISAASISRWISCTIKLAYKDLSARDLSFLRIRPHEIRALSASWAFSNNVPLEDILRAAVWKSQSTFSTFYLRSMSAQTENLFSLGPLVASQRVIC